MNAPDFASTGPDTLAGRYLRRFWQPIYFASDLPIGRALPVRSMSEDFTLFRGAAGNVYTVDFRCPHRGMQLSAGWVEGESIRCRYHGWRFEGSGQCVEAPAEHSSFPGKIRIKGHPTREYLGLIFVYLGEDEPPEFPLYPEWESGGVLEVTGYVRPCNYFQNLENGVDPLHTPFTHRNSIVTNAGLAEIPRISATRSEWGITVTTVRSNSTRTILLGMPNISNVKLPSPCGGWKDSLAWRVPVDDTTHRSFILYRHPCTPEEAARAGIVSIERGHAEITSSREDLAAVLSGRLRLEDAVASPDSLVDLQDCVAQVGQGVIADRRREQLGRSDVGVGLLRRIWAHELSTLSNKESPTKWHRPTGLMAT